ncbi:hypothetical protein F5Y09DRAFT_354995 [Xylaria sp. FL1042]|nr:hypothetical protein F5Y09DRAFT_354995 [Xylaria sp. FL1042]
MAFQFKAFDLTVSEKYSVLRQIRSLVSGAGALIARAKASPVPSPHDYSEALNQINKAISIATDQDACDPLLAPLATCYLYKGHILLALNCLQEAREAYKKAAATKTRDFIGFTDAGATSQDEAKYLLGQWDDITKSVMPLREYSTSSRQSGLVDGTPGEVFTDIGPDGIAMPVTRRPGPVKLRRVKRVAANLCQL